MGDKKLAGEKISPVAFADSSAVLWSTYFGVRFLLPWLFPAW